MDRRPRIRGIFAVAIHDIRFRWNWEPPKCSPTGAGIRRAVDTRREPKRSSVISRRPRFPIPSAPSESVHRTRKVHTRGAESRISEDNLPGFRISFDRSIQILQI